MTFHRVNLCALDLRATTNITLRGLLKYRIKKTNFKYVRKFSLRNEMIWSSCHNNPLFLLENCKI